MSFVYQGNELLYPNPVKDGLILYYDFKGMKNSDTTKGIAKDLSGKGNNGTLSNFAYTSVSGYNNGLNLDGVDDSVLVGDNSSIISLNSEVTVEMSILFNESPDFWRWLIGNVSDAAGNKGYALAFSPTSTQRLTFIAGGTVLNTGYMPSENEKMHLVGKIDSSNNISLTMNGVVIKSIKAIKSMANSTLPVNIGKASYYQSPHLKSNILSAKIYNRALTDQEIQHNYQIEKERWGL
ncbi:LamG domain-containing protein [Mammaliicoccus sp. E-M24]|uniref:LamG domain-containing protein n=1 Tax=Mammaliicoccus sp. E-M24 TaxID=2898684 RepID=UPI001EFA630D|nr:LamG domain-containing protein [Mammaliicoccus sp. E-M24]